MGRNARRRHGELPSGWNFTNGNKTVPIRTQEDFHAALTWIMGGDEDADTAKEATS
jgi:hypothetical protein